jgi:hypothetical protein
MGSGHALADRRRPTAAATWRGTSCWSAAPALREKGKVGRDHTTSVEHVWGHGLPDHQKAEAKRLVEALLAEGCLDEKVSQGRRHLWLTVAGLERLSRAEESAAAAAAS